MTKEESIKVLTQYIDYDAETPDYYEMEKACKVAIKALEQIDVLNKIKEEIKDNTYFINEITEKEGIDFETVEKIINKYRKE